MTTLFSPVGKSDPITYKGDGPMLHIVRHRRPDKVVLFLSPEMKGFQEMDGRYTDAIERLCIQEKIPMPEVRLEFSSFEEVHKFDCYIEEFEKVLRPLADEVPGEPILANVTSGTPAMQSALIAIGAFGRPYLKMLQVPTPYGGINRPGDKEDPYKYDPDFMWECYLEKESVAKIDRIDEVMVPNFACRLLRQNISALVEGYDYEAAHKLAITEPGISEQAKQMVAAARDRLNLSGALPTRVFYRSALEYRPDDLLGEYLSIMEVRLAQGHWADFMRLLTPAFTQLSILKLRESGFPECSYLAYDVKGRPTLEYNWDVIEQDRTLMRILNKEYEKGARYIKNWALMALVNQFCDDSGTKLKLRKLKNVEDDCRHPLAHNLQASGKETLEGLAGMKLELILEYLFNLHGNARRHLYADINKAILERL